MYMMDVDRKAFTKSHNKHHRGKRRTSSKKTKNDKRGKLGTLTIKITISGVTSKKDSPEYNALRERFTAFATQELEFSSPSTQQELQKFCYYLRESLNLELSKENADSFILTVHCRTLEILERLWEDYCSGHLDQIAEDCFLTDEKTKTEEERGKTDTISLETDISEADYLRCKQFLTEKEDRAITETKLNKAEILKTRNEPFKEEQILLMRHRKLVGGCWRKLGKKLGIDQKTLDNLKKNNDYLDSDRAYEVLKLWVDDKKNDATVGRLACALIDIGEEEIAERLLGEKFQQPSEQEGNPDQSSERATSEDMLRLGAEIKELKAILSEREGQQKESEKLQKQMIEEWKEMKLQLQHVLSTKDKDMLRFEAEVKELKAILNELKRQQKESEKLQKKMIDEWEELRVVAEVKELKTILSERERQQKESEKLQKQMIEEWKEMKLQLQHVLSTKDRASFQSIQPSELKKPEEKRKRETSAQQNWEKEELKAFIKRLKQMNIQVKQLC